MTMIPIHRIPLEADSPTLHAIVRGELDNRDIPKLQSILAEAAGHSANSDHTECMMDWAMQIRWELGISWAECIDAAMILYYG